MGARSSGHQLEVDPIVPARVVRESIASKPESILVARLPCSSPEADAHLGQAVPVALDRSRS